MEYKILESNGVEIENIDGASLNNLITGNKSGIVANIGKNCKLIASSNVLTINTGLVIVSGFRVKIDQPISFTLSGNPAFTTDYQLILQIILNKDKSVAGNLYVREKQVLIQDKLFINGEGIYQFEVATFKHNVDGTISSIQKSKLLDNSSNTIDVDSNFSITSENPVQNKVIAKEINAIKDIIEKINGEYKFSESGEGWLNPLITFYEDGKFFSEPSEISGTLDIVIQHEIPETAEEPTHTVTEEHTATFKTNGVNPFNIVFDGLVTIPVTVVYTEDIGNGSSLMFDLDATNWEWVDYGKYFDLQMTHYNLNLTFKTNSNSGGGNITVDSELSDTSTNPVQNKVVKAELDKKADKEITHNGWKKFSGEGYGAPEFSVNTGIEYNSNAIIKGEITTISELGPDGVYKNYSYYCKASDTLTFDDGFTITFSQGASYEDELRCETNGYITYYSLSILTELTEDLHKVVKDIEKDTIANESKIGDIKTALDAILEIQNSLLGGAE